MREGEFNMRVESNPNRLNTAFLLMAQYGPRAIIPLDQVARDYFQVTPAKLLEKIERGDVPLPVTRLDKRSAKGAKGVHLSALAAYIDREAEIADRELAAIRRADVP